MVLLIRWFHYFPAYLMLSVSIKWFAKFSSKDFCVCRGDLLILLKLADSVQKKCGATKIWIWITEQMINGCQKRRYRQMIGLLGIRDFNNLCLSSQANEEWFPLVKCLVQSIFMAREMVLLTTSLNRLFHNPSDLIIWILLLW